MRAIKHIGKMMLKTTPYMKCGSAALMLVATAAEAYVATEKVKTLRNKQQNKSNTVQIGF